MSMQILARAGHSPRLALSALVVLAACVAIEQPAAPPAHPAVARAPTLIPESPPIASRAPLLEESDAGDDSSFKQVPGALPTPALAALGPTPTRAAAPEAVAAVHPSAAEVPVPSAELESLVTHIGPATPPNVAAAMRLIEAGRQQLAQGHYDQALDRFERGVAIDPTNAYGYYYLAQLYLLMKKYDQASAFAGRAATLAMRSDRKLLARAYGLQGTVFEEVGRYADARKAYTKAVQADPDNLAARVGMGRLGGGE